MTKSLEFYDLEFKTPDGRTISMGDYRGKVVLIVNTATECGFTPQFEGLEELHQNYKDDGLVVLGFPCNQFGGQEPLSNDDMTESCRLNHGVTFQLSEKVDVNGDNAHPVFVYLKGKLGSLLGKKVKWNFTKFLVDTEGKPFKRFETIVKPESMEKHIVKLLKDAKAA